MFIEKAMPSTWMWKHEINLPESKLPGRFASQNRWNEFANVYDYLWGFLP
jgi:hypothetical protein